VQPLDRRRLEAIAVGQPLGDEVHDLGADQLERPPQDHRRRDAVDVVIAMDRDPLFPCDRAQDAIDGWPHVGQPHRIVQVLQPRIQKSRGHLGVAETALTEETGDERRQLQRVR
jgi:hypothetical protein